MLLSASGRVITDVFSLHTCRAGRHGSDSPEVKVPEGVRCLLDVMAASDARVAGLSMAALWLCIQQAAEVQRSAFCSLCRHGDCKVAMHSIADVPLHFDVSSRR